jgi:glycosyltransferase involved in cell wall biosynthesis
MSGVSAKAARPLRIAWLGPYPGDSGVTGVATELLAGLASRGHTIDYFARASEKPVPPRLAELDSLTFVWGTLSWQWNRWYSRGRLPAFITGLIAQGLATVRLRRAIARRHRLEPYDIIYQFSSIETLAVSARVAREIPLVIHPETHIAGELRFFIAERGLFFRCQPRHVFAIVVSIMSVRALVQRVSIRHARLLVCISRVFRDHLVHDYRFPLERTVVVPNPARVERFSSAARPVGDPPTVLVLGRISTRKGVDDVLAVARLLLEREVEVRLRIVGGPSLWSDYTKLLQDLPGENAEYTGETAAAEVPAELARSDVLLQASKYEPFGLTVAEALAAGVPVVATSEVGAIEGVDRAVVTELAPGDVAGMATAITTMLERLSHEPTELRALARAEAQRLFATERVCEQISLALEQLVAGSDQLLAGSAPGSPEPV